MKTKDYVGDAMGAVSVNIIFNLAGMMIYFYTDVIGLAISAVSTVLLLSKVIDSFTDIGMGVLVDRTKSKYGMARPWLMRMAIPSLLIFPLMFTVPSGVDTNIKLAYIAVTNFLFLSVIYTAIAVPYGTLISLQTKEPYERSRIGLFRLITAYAASSVVNILLIPTVNYFGGSSGAWVSMGIIYGVVSMTTLAAAFFLTKERNTVSPEYMERVPILQGIKLLISNKYWIMVMVVNVIINLIYALASGTSVYYVKYILGNVDLVAAVGLSDLAFAGVGFILVGIAVKKAGNRNTVLLGMVIAVIGSILRTINPYNVIQTVIFRGLTTIGGTTVLAVNNPMVADSIEYGWWKTGKRIAGLSASSASFGAKLGAAVWAGAIGWILGWSGYDGLLSEQPISTCNMIIFLNIYFPLICYVVIILIMLFYKLDKEYKEILKELEIKKIS